MPKTNGIPMSVEEDAVKHFYKKYKSGHLTVTDLVSMLLPLAMAEQAGNHNLLAECVDAIVGDPVDENFDEKVTALGILIGSLVPDWERSEEEPLADMEVFQAICTHLGFDY